MVCPDCKGSGMQKCEHCEGNGCKRCNKTGVNGQNCPRCGGEGWV